MTKWQTPLTQRFSLTGVSDGIRRAHGGLGPISGITALPVGAALRRGLSLRGIDRS